MNKKTVINLISIIALISVIPLFAEVSVQKTAFKVESKSPTEMEIKFDLPQYQIAGVSKSGRNYAKIEMADANYLTEIGMPELPVLSTMIAIPQKGGVSVEIINSRTQEIAGIIPYPVQKEVSETGMLDIDSAYYNGIKQVSTEVVQYSEPQILRDFRVVSIQLQPFIWNAVSRNLTVYEQISLRITFSNEKGVNELSASPVISSTFDKLYDSLILNYADYRTDPVPETPPRIVILYGAYADNTFLTLLNNFALWKRQKGADVTVVNTTQTGSSNTSIKSYLQGLYNNPATRPDYIVIVGDVTGNFAIPAWNVDGIGDYPYQMLAGNDQLGDVFLGRISAENTSQLSVIFAKIYAYEKNMNVTNAQWLNRMLITTDTLYDGISVVNLAKYIKEISQRQNPNYSYTMLCQNSPNPSDMNNAINQGIGFFTYRGYAGMSGWSVNENNLFNGSRLFHAVIPTCNTGNYDATATTEQIIRVGTSASLKGAVTAIGMWGAGTATMPNNALTGGIFSGIFMQDMRTMGEALLYSKLYFARLYQVSNPVMNAQFTQWCNLMGDPTMEVYITIPNTFLSNVPTSLPAGFSNLDVTVTDQNGLPVANAWVTLSINQGTDNIIISRAYTDAEGFVYLPFSQEIDAGNIVITISKPNFLPLQQNISIGSGSLVGNPVWIDDDNEGNSSGNGNDAANAGETVEAYFALRNTSENAINNITGSVSCSSHWITITDSLVNFNSINAGENATSTIPVIMQLSSQTPNNTLLKFVLQLTDSSGGSYNLPCYFSVTDAELSFISHQIVDGGNSVLEPGETASLLVTLQNIGSLDALNLNVELFTDNDLVEVLDSLSTFGTISVGEQVTNATNNFLIRGRSELVKGMIIPMRMRITNQAGFLQWITFQLTIGVVTVNDPLGPDAYGYLIYDDGDIAYSECPVYNWTEIAPIEGGSGTALNITDPDEPGEGDGLAAISLSTVDLPFNFQFYGQQYHQITVCSNGFIVMGVTENGEFRNYRLPGPMGPSPMIAAFWDDLATGPLSGIYTWFDSSHHLFIIEWHQMLNGYDNDYAETFQMILYDPAYYPTSLGDGPIKIQYQTYNNVDSGATNQNHGNFCTIGIENGGQTDGLEYSFLNTYPLSASPLGNNRALYISTMPVYHNNAWLEIGDTYMNDQNNQLAEPGESIELGVQLHNIGNRQAEEIRANLSCLDPYVTIINAFSDYHPIAGNNYGINIVPFTFTIADNCPGNHSLLFTLDIISSNHNWSYTFRINVKTANIVYQSFFLNDINGNNNGIAEPGENIQMIVNVKNLSELSVLGLSAQLSSDNTHITITNPTLNLYELDSNEIGQFAFNIQLNESTPLNNSIPMLFTLSAENSASLSASLDLGCGAIGMNSDFENDNGNFSNQNGWAWGQPQQVVPFSGNNVWATTLVGQYNSGANYFLTSAPVNIGTGAVLSFWHQLYCQGNFDGGNVSISTNGGLSWTVITPASGSSYVGSIYSMNEPGFSGTIGNWTKVTFNLSSYANQEILIRWHFTSDGSVSGYGWFIDDVSVSGFSVKTGFVSGVLSLSNGESPLAAKISTPYSGAAIVSHPHSDGNYELYLPVGTYTLTATMDYYESANTQEFSITNQSLPLSYDFLLNYLPAPENFYLAYDEETNILSLSWTPPEEPVYPVLNYIIYQKVGPGAFAPLTTLEATSFSEELTLSGHYNYYVRAAYIVGEGAPTETLEQVIGLPDGSNEPVTPQYVTAINANYPNPFNPSTVISFSLAKTGPALIKIYNLKGQVVKTLYKGVMEAGQHKIFWNGLDNNNCPVSSGVYFCRLETGKIVHTRKMTLLK